MTSSSSNGIDVTERRRAEEPLRESEAKFRDKAVAARGDHEDVPPLSSSSQIGHFIKWKLAKRHTALLHEAGYLLLGLVSLATVTGLYFWLDAPLVAATFTYLVVLVLLSLVSNFSSLTVLSFIGVCCLSYFFAPPIYSFRVDYSQDLITISAFVITSFIINFLVTRVRVEQRERKRAEQALRESEYKLHQIFDTVPGLTWSTGSDGSQGKKAEAQPGFLAQVQAILNVLPAYTWYSVPSGGLTFVSKRTAEYLGIPKDHPLRSGIDIGAQWDDWVPLLHPDDQEEARKYWSNLLCTGEGGEHSYRVRSAQGDYRWFLTRIEPLRASDGTLLLWLAATLDIEEFKCAEQALRESEYKLRQIIDTVPSLLWSAGPDGEPTHVSQRLVDYSGMRLEDFKHRGWEAVVHPTDLPETAKAFDHAIRTGASFQGVHRLRRAADGAYRWHHARFEPLRDREGRIIQWYGSSVDIDDGKKAEERLRRNEAHLTEAQRLSHTGASAYNRSRILYWSEETYRIWGFDRAQGLPSREAMLQRVHPDDRDRVRTEAERSFVEEQGPLGYRIILPDGRAKHLESISQPMFSASGELVEVVATHADVTERKRAEEALRESEFKLHQIVETVPSLLWSLAPDGEPTHFNRRFLDYFGKPFEDFKHGGWLALIHPDDVLETERTFSHAIQTGISYHGVLRFRRADGEYRWHEGRGEPLRDRQGNIVQWYGLSVDIDEAKKAEDRLRRSEAHLAEAQRLSHSGVSAYNETTILYGSDETYRIWGFDPAQGVPSLEAMRQRIHPDDLDRHLATVQRALDEKTGYSIAYRIVLPDGTVKHLESIGQPVFSESGELVEVVSTQMDVTERKRAEQALRESEYKLHQIVEAVPSLVWSLAPDGEPTHFNQRLLDYFGKPFEDFKHAGWGPFVHPDDIPETEKAFSYAIQTGISYQGVLRLRRADGEYRWHNLRCEPLRDQQGCIVQWYGLSVDIDEAKKAEELLRRSEANLAEAQKLSHTGSVIYNGKAVLYASDETYRIWGFDPAQDLPSREVVFQRIHPDDRDRVNAEVRWEVGRKRGFATGYRIVLPDGTVKHLETIGQPVFSASGKLVEIVATQTDVTERKRAEEGLRESEAKFRDYAETASDWFWEIGPDYKFTLLTENAFGSGASNRIGTACWDHALDLETEPDKWRLMQATLDSRKPIRDFVYCGLSGNGTPMYVRASGKPMVDADGEFRGYRGTATDVTAIMRAQEALRESERSARSAIDGIAGLVAVMTPNGEVETVNRQCIEYFGRPLEEQKDWVTTNMVHPEDLPQMLENFKRAIASEIPYHFEQRLRRFDGEYRWFDTRGGAVRDDSGRIVRWYVLLTDIEDRTRTLVQLEQMQSDFAHMNRVSMMGELAASLSHEITQPIASARNNARAAQNFLDMQPPDMGEVREALGCVVGDTDRAGDMIDRIRDHMKKAPPRKGQFDLNEAINEVIVLGRSAAIKNGVSVQTRLSEGLFPIRGDRVQLQQVVLNLLLNAVEAMSSSEEGVRELLISTEQDHRGVLVAVRDTGPGLDPSHLVRVFDAFYTTKSSGMGMGLSICRSIIAAHGGRLWAEPNEPRGAVFQFTLPAAP